MGSSTSWHRRLSTFARAAHLKNQGQDPDRRYWHDVVGYNYRMTDIQAAVGRVQLRRLFEAVRERRAAAERYGALLKSISNLEPPYEPNAVAIRYLVFLIRCTDFRGQMQAWRGVLRRVVRLNAISLPHFRTA